MYMCMRITVPQKVCDFAFTFVTSRFFPFFPFFFFFRWLVTCVAVLAVLSGNCTAIAVAVCEWRNHAHPTTNIRTLPAHAQRGR